MLVVLTKEAMARADGAEEREREALKLARRNYIVAIVACVAAVAAVVVGVLL